jgi:hypothetical protein
MDRKKTTILLYDSGVLPQNFIYPTALTHFIYSTSAKLDIDFKLRADLSSPTINDVVQLISRSDDPYPRLLIDYSMLKTAANATSIARPSTNQ